MFAASARRLLAWLTAVVMLVAACLPGLGPLLVQQGGPVNWVELCSVKGSRWVALADDGAVLASSDRAPAGMADVAHPVSGDAHDGTSPCPFCAHHAPALDVLSADALRVAMAPRTAPPAPPAYLHGPRQQHAWSPLQSRAPPVLV